VSSIDFENMEGYKKVIKAKANTEENEIHVTSKGEIKKYHPISFILSLISIISAMR
jgi:hypothetical protein